MSAIIASRGEYDPASVAAPGVVTVHVVAVGFGQRADGAVLQVFDVEVRAFVPDVELPEIT